MSYIYTIKTRNWFHFENPIERVVSLKLICLDIIVLFTLDVQFYVLPLMTLYIIDFTTISK